MGGIFKGKSFYDDKNIEHAFMMCWGTLTYDAETKPYNKIKSSFRIKYHAESFMQCEAWGDLETPTIRIMSGLEKGDMVFCMGLWSNKSYTNRNGEVKQYSSLVCDLVIPITLISFLVGLYGSEPLLKILNNTEADGFESEDEQIENYEESNNHTENYDSAPPPDGFESIEEELPF